MRVSKRNYISTDAFSKCIFNFQSLSVDELYILILQAIVMLVFCVNVDILGYLVGE